MNSQSTPVHIRLWHKDFWLMAIANFLLAMTVYMLVPTMPKWLIETQQMGMVDAGIAMGAFGVGLFALGAFISYLVQHYRRNLVCIYAVLAEALLIGVLYYIDGLHMRLDDPMIIIVHRLAQGAAFGLAQMVLTSTLIIDTSESFQRTEANHSAAWFSRFALSMGPMAGLLIGRLAGFHYVLLGTIACAVAVAVLVLTVNFPFRAPQDDIPTVSLDRFFLPHGFPLFVNLQLVTLAVGIILSVILDEHFYSMMMMGFAAAILAQRFVFRDAELKSEVVTGLDRTNIDRSCSADDDNPPSADSDDGSSAVYWYGYRTDRVEIPVVLHQVESPLPAWYIAEHIPVGMGERYSMGCGLRIGCVPGRHYIGTHYCAGTYRGGTGDVSLYAQLVYE